MRKRSPAPAGAGKEVQLGRVSDLEAATAEFKRKGVTVVREPRPYENLTYAFFLDPNGISVELLQHGH